MKKITFRPCLILIASLIAISVLLELGVIGCGKKEPALSKDALAFKKEIKQMFEKYSPLFIEPLSKGDKAAVQATLGKLSSDLTKEGQPLTWGGAVLDKEGITVGTLASGGPQAGLNYSNVKQIADVLKNHKMVQGKLYRQDGLQAHYVVGPLLRQGELVGLFVIGMPADEVNQKWKVSEKEFMAINFNE